MFSEYQNLFKPIRLSDYTLNSPLTLRDEYVWLKTNDEDKRNLYNPQLSRTFETGTSYHELKTFSSLGFVTGVEVISLLAKIRLYHQPTESSISKEVSRLHSYQFHPDIQQDFCAAATAVLTGVDRSEIPQPLHQTFEQLTFHLEKNREILADFVISKELEMGIVWSNIAEESGGVNSAECEWVRNYGWTMEGLNNLQLITRECSFFDPFVGAQRTIIMGLTSHFLLLFDLHEKKTWCINKKFLLCEKDTRVQRWISKLVCEWNTSLPQECRFNIPRSDELQELYFLGDIVLAKAGNKGYNWIKALESYLVSKAQSVAEGETIHSLSTDFYKFMYNEINEYGVDYSIVEETERLHDLTAHMSFGVLLELSGLFRHWGHPVIWVEDGLLSVYENSTKVLPTNLPLMRRLARHMTYLLLNWYQKRHFTKWPPGTKVYLPVTPQEQRLREYVRRNVFPTRGVALALGDAWLSVDFGTIFDDLGDIPVLALIKDTRHAKTRSELSEVISHGTRATGASDSVIETFLKTPYVNVREFLAEVNEHGIDDEYLVIVLKEKERELKVKGRFFSLMTFVLRVYFTATEYLIERHILPLFPEITMCKDQLDFTMQMLSATCGEEDKSKISHHMISIDFEKWNNYQREESTFTVFQVIDRAFGWEHVISRTHELFSRCIILYGNALNKVNKRMDGPLPYCWRNHLGGFEGLRQKGWSVVGALIIRDTAYVVGNHPKVLLQGDNQVIILQYITSSISNQEDLRFEKERHKEITRHFLEILCASCASLGLKTKPEETWMSSSLLYYGKWAFVNGVAQSLILKKLCRIFHIANDIVPSLTNSLASLHTTCISVCLQSHWSAPFYLFGIWYSTLVVGYIFDFDPAVQRGLWDANILLREKELVKQRYPQLSPLSIESTWNPQKCLNQSLLLLDITIRDAAIGGIGGSGPLRYLSRQFPDPVTEALAGLKLLYESVSHPSVRHLLATMGYPLLAEDKKFEILLQDPTSLNLTGATKPTNLIKDFVKRQLTDNRNRYIANRMCREALYITSTAHRDVMKFFESIEPFFPRFLAKLYSVTPVGVTEGIISHITGSRTAYKLASQFGALDKLKLKLLIDELLILLSLERHHCQYWTLGDRGIWTCSTQHAQMLRDDGWGRPIVGVTIPHPLEQWVAYPCKGRTCPRCLLPFPIYDIDRSHDVIKVIVSEDLLENPLIAHHVKGPFKPYLGGHTIERRIAQSEVELSTKESILKPLVRLLNLAGWCYDETSAISSYLKSLLNTYVPGSSDYIHTLFDITSGNLLHRFKDPHVSDGSGCANNPNLGTHVCFSTDSLPTIGRGQENFVVLFQSIFCIFGSRIPLMFQLLNRTFKCVHLHLGCCNCLPKAPDFKLQCSRSVGVYGLASYLESDISAELMDNVRPSIPKTIDTTYNPFAVSPSSLFISPLSMTTDILNVQLTDIDLEKRRSCCHASVAYILLNQLGVIPGSNQLENYKLPVSLLRKITLEDLFKYLATLSVAESYIRLLSERRSNVRFGKITWINLTSHSLNVWSRISDRTLGGILAHTESFRQVLQAKVYHNASYPTKGNQVGSSFILIMIDKLSAMGVEDLEDLPALIPGDLVTLDTLTNWVLYQNIISRLKSNKESMYIVSIIGLKEHLTERVSIHDREKLDKLKDACRTLINLWPSKRKNRLGRVNMDLKSFVTETDFMPNNSLDYQDVNFDIYDYSSAIKEAQVVWELSMAIPVSVDADTFPKGLMSPILHVFRPIWYSANGGMKMLSLIKGLGNVFSHSGLIGDGNGGFGLIVAQLPECQTIWFNSLPEYKGMTEQEGAYTVPAALASSPKILEKVVNLDYLDGAHSDITKPEWVKYVRANWDELKYRPTILICDAEFYDYSLMKHLWSNLWALRDYCEHVLVKMHLDVNQHIKKQLPHDSRFVLFKVWRSPYSHFGKYEVYVQVKWKPPKNFRGVSYSYHNLPTDTALVLCSSLFVTSPESQLHKINYLVSPYGPATRAKGLLERTLSTRQKVGALLKLPLSKLKKLEDDYKRGYISYTQALLILAVWILKLGFFHQLFEHDISMLDDWSTVAERKDISNWTGGLIGILILYGAFAQHRELYECGCTLYSQGAIVTPQWSFQKFGLSVRPRQNKQRTKGQIDFRYQELKACIHDLIRYLGGFYWQRGRQRFQRQRVTMHDQKLETLLFKLTNRANSLIPLSVDWDLTGILHDANPGEAWLPDVLASPINLNWLDITFSPDD